MAQDAKIGEIQGGPTVGYGQSLAKAYCNIQDGRYEIKLYCHKGGKEGKASTILFDNIESLLKVLIELKKGFRAVP